MMNNYHAHTRRGYPSSGGITCGDTRCDVTILPSRAVDCLFIRDSIRFTILVSVSSISSIRSNSYSIITRMSLISSPRHFSKSNLYTGTCGDSPFLVVLFLLGDLDLSFLAV